MPDQFVESTAYSRVLDRLMVYATLVGRIEGLLDCHADDLLTDFDALMQIRELLATHRMLMEEPHDGPIHP